MGKQKQLNKDEPKDKRKLIYNSEKRTGAKAPAVTGLPCRCMLYNLKGVVINAEPGALL